MMVSGIIAVLVLCYGVARVAWLRGWHAGRLAAIEDKRLSSEEIARRFGA